MGEQRQNASSGLTLHMSGANHQYGSASCRIKFLELTVYKTIMYVCSCEVLLYAIRCNKCNIKSMTVTTECFAMEAFFSCQTEVLQRGYCLKIFAHLYICSLSNVHPLSRTA